VSIIHSLIEFVYWMESVACTTYRTVACPNSGPFESK
jgi:hypothetical protein